MIYTSANSTTTSLNKPANSSKIWPISKGSKRQNHMSSMHSIADNLAHSVTRPNSANSTTFCTTFKPRGVGNGLRL